jgi:hypothetical protein
MTGKHDVLTEKSRRARETRDRIRKVLREQHAHVPRKVLDARETLIRHYQTMRSQLHRTGNYDPLQCEAKIHRVELTVVIFPLNAFPWKAFTKLPGARLLDPERLWNQTYGLVRRVRCTGGIRELTVEYQRSSHWADPFRITILPRHRAGLLFEDLNAVIQLLPNFKIVLIEVAFDFPITSIVDVRFVQERALFGRSWPRFVGINPLHDSWGTRKSQKFVRSYVRFETDSHRIELELHSRFLRQHRIDDIQDFPRLVEILVSNHIQFAQLDRQRLIEQLRRNGLDSRERQNVVEQLQDREEDCLCGVLKYLRRRVKLKNVRRFLNPVVEINQVIREASDKWARTWPPTPEALGEKQ